LSGKADDPHGSGARAGVPNDDNAKQKAKKDEKCNATEEHEVPNTECPGQRGVGHGSPQPLDPTDDSPPPDNGDPAPTDDSDNDNDSEDE
jgi:hypothetical protein